MCKRETTSGKPFSVSSQRSTLAAVKSFFEFCTLERIILIDPCRTVEMPKMGRRLPQGVLSPKEMRQLLKQPNLDTCAGLRDPAILERSTRPASAMRSCVGSSSPTWTSNVATPPSSTARTKGPCGAARKGRCALHP